MTRGKGLVCDMCKEFTEYEHVTHITLWKYAAEGNLYRAADSDVCDQCNHIFIVET